MWLKKFWRKEKIASFIVFHGTGICAVFTIIFFQSRCSVREFFPQGELIPNVDLTIITAPLYEKNQLYVINDVDTRTLKVSQQTARSDNTGRLRISLNGSAHEIGINGKNDPPWIALR